MRLPAAGWDTTTWVGYYLPLPAACHCLLNSLRLPAVCILLVSVTACRLSSWVPPYWRRSCMHSCLPPVSASTLFTWAYDSKVRSGSGVRVCFDAMRTDSRYNRFSFCSCRYLPTCRLFLGCHSRTHHSGMEFLVHHWRVQIPAGLEYLEVGHHLFSTPPISAPFLSACPGTGVSPLNILSVLLTWRSFSFTCYHRIPAWSYRLPFYLHSYGFHLPPPLPCSSRCHSFHIPVL